MRIVVLGGTGQAGRCIVRLLAEKTDASIVVAVRNLQKAQAMLRDVAGDANGRRIDAFFADATKPETLKDVFRGADLVIVASSTSEHSENVIGACVDAGCDYFDILDAPDTLDVLKRFGARIEGAGRLFVTQGGLAPGMPSAMVRLARPYFDRYLGARIGLALSLRTAERYEQVYDVFEFLVKTRPVYFYDGAWRKKSFKDSVVIDYGERFGRRAAFLIDMPELRDLPAQLGLREMGVYAAGTNVVVEHIVKSLVVGLHRIRPRLGWRTLAKLIYSLSRRMTGEPGGFSSVLEAWGAKNGRNVRVRVLMEHEDNNFATGAVVVSFVKQRIGGAFDNAAGIQMMGHLIHPERCIQELREMGVTIRVDVSENGTTAVERQQATGTNSRTIADAKSLRREDHKE